MFPPQDYSKPEQQEVTLFNSSRVPFDFEFDVLQVSREGVVQLEPQSGRIKGDW